MKRKTVWRGMGVFLGLLSLPAFFLWETEVMRPYGHWVIGAAFLSIVIGAGVSSFTGKGGTKTPSDTVRASEPPVVGAAPLVTPSRDEPEIDPSLAPPPLNPQENAILEGVMYVWAGAYLLGFLAILGVVALAAVGVVESLRGEPLSWWMRGVLGVAVVALSVWVVNLGDKKALNKDQAKKACSSGN
jgi:hypothetical protein